MSCVAMPFISGMLPLIGGQMSRRFFKRVVTTQADFHAASPSEWQLARQREAVIRPLAEADRLSPQKARGSPLYKWACNSY